MTDSEKLDLILSEMQGMKSEIQELKRRVTSIELHIENATDKNLAYEVKVNYLIEEVDKIKEEIVKLKSKIA